ncbi:hypothetical protein NL676_000579 [Syzygium grande]|nr:hypothetical protein NL676_000579 [Syzygium grande]
MAALFRLPWAKRVCLPSVSPLDLGEGRFNIGSLGSMDVKLSIGEEEVGMDASIQELVQKDEGGASLNMLDDGMDSMKEEKTARTAEQQDPAEVYAAARKLADVIKGANVEGIVSTIETLAHQTHSSAIFNFRGLPRGSLLHIAAATGKSNILRLLLDHVDAHLIAAEDDWGNTPLHCATKAKALGVAGMLIHRARDLPNVETILRIKNKNGNTALHEAVLTCDVEMVRFLLNEDLEPVYWQNAGQKSPLYLAIETNNPAIHDILFSLSLEPSKIEGLPPIHGAITHSDDLVADKILEQNVKLFAMTDSRGKEYTIRNQSAWLALACSCIGKVSPSKDLIIFRPEAREKESGRLVRSRNKMPKRKIVNDYIDSRMVVATLVATVTFAAGFAVPGGFNGSDTASKDDRGMATMLDNKMFQAFAICNTIAMFCSMTAVVNLIWRRSSDVHIAITAYESTTLPLKIALPAMSVAFLTGVTLTVGKLPLAC